MADQDFSFSPRLRLKKAVEYQRVFAEPFSTSDKFFTILARRNELDYSRLGLAIAKKNIKRAVDRNKIKRLARESFRNNHFQIGYWDIVVLAKMNAANAEKKTLSASLIKHWLKLAERCDSYSNHS